MAEGIDVGDDGLWGIELPESVYTLSLQFVEHPRAHMKGWLPLELFDRALVSVTACREDNRWQSNGRQSTWPMTTKFMCTLSFPILSLCHHAHQIHKLCIKQQSIIIVQFT